MGSQKVGHDWVHTHTHTYSWSVTKSRPALCDPMDCSMPGSLVLHYLLEFVPIHVNWIGDAISSSATPFPFYLQSFPESGAFPVSWLFALDGQRTGASAFSISPSSEYLGLISFRIDRFDLLAVQRTLKNLLQHHNLKASILWHPTFFMVQLSHLYVSTGKTIALTIWTFVGKVMSLLFNMLSRFVIPFLPRSKCLLISWLQSHPIYLIHGPNIPGSYAILFFAASDLTFTNRHIHNWALFPLWSSIFILSGAISPPFASSILDIDQPGGAGLIFQCHYLFAFSNCSWCSRGKNTGVVCHSLLQWTTFCQNSPPWLTTGPAWYGS